MGETEYLLIIIVFNFFLLAFIAAAITFVIQYKNKKKENQAMLVQQQILHQKELLSAEMEVQVQTMQHIGREIHDNVGQKLTLASLYTQQLAFENKVPEINNKIEDISEIINQSLTELRKLSRTLTDNNIEKDNIIELLKQEFARVERLKKYEIRIKSNIEELTLSYQVKNVLVRVVQEFLQNSMKYANAGILTADIYCTTQALRIELTDDGQGFDPEQVMDKGSGLKNMKKRMALIGGDCILQSQAGAGTRLTLEIALPQ
ncbi:Sensor histidine kinase LiaS [compost metagenome]